MKTTKTDKSMTIVKVGGARLSEAKDLDALTRYLRRLIEEERRPVIVHGGGPQINQLHERLDVPTLKREGIRVTRDQGMDIATMVLCGLVNKKVVAHLVSAGIAAVGLSGVDAGLLHGELLDEREWGRVGRKPNVDAALLSQLVALGRVPIIAPISLGPDGNPMNVNADDAAHALATACGASSLEFVSDVPGVLDDRGRVVADIEKNEVPSLVKRQVIRGGMIPKIEAAVQAIDSGVGRVMIGDLHTLTTQTCTQVIP